MDLKGRIALVTGGGTGLGHAIAIELGRRGAGVAVNYATSREAASGTVTKLEALGVAAIAVQADVSTPQGPAELVAEVEETLGPIELLVNNAGVTRGIPIEDLAGVRHEDWQSMFGVNVIGAFHCAQAAVPGMIERGEGSILNVASIAPYVATGSSIPYVVSKAGLISLTECLSKALPASVRVNAVAPGWMHTPWLERNLHPELLDQVKSGELPSVAVDDVARASIELLANDAVNGETLILDGGDRWKA